MQMQEPEQQQQYRQEWSAEQQYGGYQAEYPAREEQEQGEQGQKVYPEKQRGQVGKVIGIIAIVLSSIGFFLSLTGIIISALVLQFANGREVWQTGGVVGLVVSILIMVACIVCFVFAVVALAIRSRRIRRQRQATF